MKIAIVGTGYVGLVSGVCFANMGHEVICVDSDKRKIRKLCAGESPIFEPGLKELLGKMIDLGRIKFTGDLANALEIAPVVFIAVGTPQDVDGSADLSYVLQVAKEIAAFATSAKLIVTKSTVPAGTGNKIKALVKETNPDLDFAIASNPEFLREGFAISDFDHPDRIVIGVESKQAQNLLLEIYQKFDVSKIVITDIISAELIKYASNSFLATKIAFINEMANLCEKTGGNIKDVSIAMGLDSRIGDKFLNPGPGFGGSCFPKDIMAISKVAKDCGVELSIIDAVINSNNVRPLKMIDKILNFYGSNIEGAKIAVLGLAFKGNTDDIRYSPAITIVKQLLKLGSKVRAHDFQAIENSRDEIGDNSRIEYFTNQYEAIADCDLIVIATEWSEYKDLDLKKVKSLTDARKIVDLRNLLKREQVTNSGFKYCFIGSKNA